MTVDQATGLVRTIGPLQTDVSAVGGFDAVFAPGGYEAFAVLQPAGAGISFLYRIDLATGVATSLGQIDGGELLDGLAIVPEPGGIAVLTCAAPLLLARRRRHRA